MNCELCGQPVKIEGRTTKYYVDNKDEIIEKIRVYLVHMFIWSKNEELPKDECLNEAKAIYRMMFEE